MAYIKYKDADEFIEAIVCPVANHVVRITGEDITPSENGFRLYLRDNDLYPLDNGEYDAYTTLYNVGEGWFELSDDGSVYEEFPEVIPETLTEEQKAELEKRQQISTIQNQIINLKAQITATDYQVIKTYEYSLVGLESDYDIEALHQERQAIRNQINELEIRLAELTETE